ncbi:hypothetical protein OS493_040410, partial [Desmophyllum pertusum]
KRYNYAKLEIQRYALRKEELTISLLKPIDIGKIDKVTVYAMRHSAAHCWLVTWRRLLLMWPSRGDHTVFPSHLLVSSKPGRWKISQRLCIIKALSRSFVSFMMVVVPQPTGNVEEVILNSAVRGEHLIFRLPCLGGRRTGCRICRQGAAYPKQPGEFYG